MGDCGVTGYQDSYSVRSTRDMPWTMFEAMLTTNSMWPGSEAHIGGVEPEYVDAYNGHEELNNKVHRILGWLDLPGPSDVEESESPNAMRPQLIAAYVPNVDSDGHLYGPNSTYIRR